MERKRVYYYEDDNLKVRISTARYKFCLPFLKDKVVLDIGCGARQGPWIISNAARMVVASDMSHEAVSHASKIWAKSNICYMVTDSRNLAFTSNSFDVVLCLEVIEHIDDHRACLLEARRLLKDGGVCIISTPNGAVTAPGGMLSNPDHVREFDLKQFKSVLLEHFSTVTVYGQKPSRDVIAAEDLLRGACQNAQAVPHLVRQILPKALKKQLLNTYFFLISRISSLRNPNEILEEDFIFEKDTVEEARHLVAVCGG